MGKANESWGTHDSFGGKTPYRHSSSTTGFSRTCMSSTSSISDGRLCASHSDSTCSCGAILDAGDPSDGDSHASLKQTLPTALSSPFRLSLEYDLCVCHSAKDDREAEHLVSYLEATARSLRCFLPPRDCPLGSPVPTELCRAVQSSHCWLFLMTSHFLQDDWCLYQMHQALSEAPMSNRIIPTVLHLPYSSCPKELRFYYMIDLSRKKGQENHGYDRVYKAVLKCKYKIIRSSNVLYHSCIQEIIFAVDLSVLY